MKLLRLTRSLNPSGGGPMEGVRQITPHLAALGVATTVASLDPPDAPWLQDQPYEAIGLGLVATGYGYRRGLPPRIRGLALQARCRDHPRHLAVPRLRHLACPAR